ncbi:MAG: transglutaminase-like domain-containing protein [Aquaticitalea sp.]
MVLEKILWTFKRHPFLYRSRFKLLSRNSTIKEIELCSYNQLNPKNEIPAYFFEINSLIFDHGIPDSDLEKVKMISKYLLENIKGGPGLSVPSEEALKIMIAGHGGVCSDMAQIFNNFCVINNIRVREWGSTRAPFEKEYGGHSYNEVYIDDYKKWVLVDVSYCILFWYKSTPLSVIELYQHFRDGENVTYTSFVDDIKKDEASVQRNYLHLNTIPFLICNYRNKVYDTFLKKLRPHVPVFFVHFLIYTLGKSYHYKFPLDDFKKILI